MNEHLLDLYRGLCAKAATSLPAPLIERLMCPFFPCPRDGWHQAAHRILMVGQQPNNWGFDDGYDYKWPYPPIWSLREAIAYEKGAEALMWAYRTHIFDIKLPHRVDPFEASFNSMASYAQRDGSGEVVGTNLFRCALQTANPKARSPLLGTAQDLAQILDWQRGCLAEEIRALAPTAVVFFTGPDYDVVLRDEFPGVEMAAVDERRDRWFAKVVHRSLPDRSFRTYHPSHLWRYQQQKWPWVEELAARATACQLPKSASPARRDEPR